MDKSNVSKQKSYYGVKGWLIVFVVFLGLNLLLTLIQGIAYETDIFLFLITLVFTVLIIVFLFTKKIIFRLLFIILMAIDIGFSLMHIFRIIPFENVFWYSEYIVFFLISLAKLLVFTIYLFKSKRVSTTFENKPTTLSGSTSAFLIFIISFLVLNTISLIETILRTNRMIIRFNQMPFISNIMAYVIPIILSALIILHIIKRKPSFRTVFIAMMAVHTALLFLVFSYFDKGGFYGYELYSYSLPINIISQCVYAFLSLIAWGIFIYKSKGIKGDLGKLSD